MPHMHARTCTHAPACTHLHACTRLHARTCTQAPARRHVHASTCTHACARIMPHMHARTCTHAPACTHLHARTCTHAPARRHVHVCTDARARTYVHARASTHARGRHILVKPAARICTVDFTLCCLWRFGILCSWLVRLQMPKLLLVSFHIYVRMKGRARSRAHRLPTSIETALAWVDAGWLGCNPTSSQQIANSKKLAEVAVHGLGGRC